MKTIILSCMLMCACGAPFSTTSSNGSNILPIVELPTVSDDAGNDADMSDASPDSLTLDAGVDVDANPTSDASVDAGAIETYDGSDCITYGVPSAECLIPYANTYYCHTNAQPMPLCQYSGVQNGRGQYVWCCQ